MSLKLTLSANLLFEIDVTDQLLGFQEYVELARRAFSGRSGSFA